MDHLPAICNLFRLKLWWLLKVAVPRLDLFFLLVGSVLYVAFGPGPCTMFESSSSISADAIVEL